MTEPFQFKVTERCLEDMEGNCMDAEELVEAFEWWLKKLPPTPGVWSLTLRGSGLRKRMLKRGFKL